MFDGTMEVTTYTINEPRQNDLIFFSNRPHNYEDLFRVKEISTVIFALNYDVKMFKLSLEYANLTKDNIFQLHVIEKYHYLIDKNKYLRLDDYKILINSIQNLELIIKEKLIWNPYSEIYENLNKNDNKILCDFINKHKYYFYDTKIPFGYNNSNVCEPNCELINHINIVDKIIF